MNYYCKCLKCKKEFEQLGLDEKKLAKEGCPDCQGKNFAWNMYVGNIESVVNWTTNECSKCHLPRVMDILNYEEIKGKLIKKGYKTKQEAIKDMNDRTDDGCYCGNLEDDNERERERQKNWGTTEANC